MIGRVSSWSRGVREGKSSDNVSANRVESSKITEILLDISDIISAKSVELEQNK